MIKNVSIQDLKALRQLGARCLVMTPSGKAYASEVLLEINDAGEDWKMAGCTAPYSGGFNPNKLNNYYDSWQESLIDLEDVDNTHTYFYYAEYNFDYTDKYIWQICTMNITKQGPLKSFVEQKIREYHDITDEEVDLNLRILAFNRVD